MSVEAMSWAFAQAIPPAPKLVLLALANNADKTSGFAFPGLALIVENCVPMGKRMVQRHIRWLTTHHLVSMEPCFTDRGRQTSNMYRLNYTTTYSGEGVTSDTLVEIPKRQGEGVTSDTLGGDIAMTPWGVTQLCHGEGVIAMTPSDKNLEPLVEPLEGMPDDSRTTRRQAGVSSATWEGYRTGYHKRYRVDPVRDARVNRDLCTLVRSLGMEEAPAVANFYVSLDDPLYMRAGHPTNLLVRDYQSLRTRWKMRAIRAPVAIRKAQPRATRDEVQIEECPADVRAVLARIGAGKAFSFQADHERGAG